MYVHHLLIYECYLENGDEDQVMEEFVKSEGHECYGPDMPSIWKKCFSVLAAWGPGNEGEMYPENVGYPVTNKEDRPQYYMLEMHYNNPFFETFVDSSGLRFFYTNQLRKYDMGVLEIGLAVASPFQVRPREYFCICVDIVKVNFENICLTDYSTETRQFRKCRILSSRMYFSRVALRWNYRIWRRASYPSSRYGLVNSMMH
jgi:hypothetical protein